jgi:hypothetical protein
VSIKISRAAPNFGGLFLKAYERAQNEKLRLLLSSIEWCLALPSIRYHARLYTRL